MTRLEYHEAAEQELLSEVGYLEYQAPGLGRHFLAEVQRVEDLITQFPESGVEIAPGIRKCLLRKFRHSLIYTIEKDRVLVLAVAHPSRRPGYWIGRTRPSGNV